MMSICLTRFSYKWIIVNPIYTINRIVLQGSGDFTWRVSDFGELEGVNHTGDYGVGFVGDYSL